VQELEHWPLDRFIEYARNPRKNDHAVDRIAAAIREFGFRVPMLAKSDGLIVDGHLRLKAARNLGLETVPVMLADDMTDSQVKAFRLSVNKMGELAEWDNELLSLELKSLDDEGFDLEMLGFDVNELTLSMGLGADFEPGTEGEQGKLDEKAPIICPACSHEFHK